MPKYARIEPPANKTKKRPLIGNIALGDMDSGSKDILGRVYGIF